MEDYAWLCINAAIGDALISARVVNFVNLARCPVAWRSCYELGCPELKQAVGGITVLGVVARWQVRIVGLAVASRPPGSDRD